MVKYIGVSYSFVAKTHRIRHWTFNFKWGDNERGIMIYESPRLMIGEKWKKAKLILR